MEIEVAPYKKSNKDPKAIAAFSGKTITKRLKIMNVSEGSKAKKVVLSSLDIEACGLEIGDQFINEADDYGMTLTPLSMADERIVSTIKPNTVSKREYKGRNGYIETVIDDSFTYNYE